MSKEQEKSPLDAGVIVTEVRGAMLEFFRSDEFKRLVKEALSEKTRIELDVFTESTPILALRPRQALG